MNWEFILRIFVAAILGEAIGLACGDDCKVAEEKNWQCLGRNCGTAKMKVRHRLFYTKVL